MLALTGSRWRSHERVRRPYVSQEDTPCTRHSPINSPGSISPVSRLDPLPYRQAISRSVRRSSKPSKRSEEHTSELQSLMRISYAVFCLKKKTKYTNHNLYHDTTNMTV